MLLQVRGSVPLFWSQQATPLSPKPDILLQQFDPVYEVSALVATQCCATYFHCTCFLVQKFDPVYEATGPADVAGCGAFP
jgi:hypothetical protein